ncbi:hypothetical protein JNB_17698 [Janibacter sp. HTCC2649]|uniref:hypothetical protein n=1 Tax=Janibacter sp. HTCC2649 TaxID=313589 RepID=UPI0000671071|nr:hypothetical protein [Janibacter sp. HTCC2649]EAP97328.1 hypothetical protein JNB_17698 [Janibacter sp. HTCC2649]
MPTDVWTYSKLLAEQLRINGVREREVREIVAQVQDHVLMTGEDPIVAFGQPADYAGTWRPLRWTSWLLRLTTACLGVTGLVALLTALVPAGDIGWTENIDVDTAALAMVAAYVTTAVLGWTVGLWLSRQRSRVLGDPRRQWLLRALSLLLFVVAVVVVGWLFVWGDDSFLPSGTAFSQPRWLVAAFGILTVPGVYFWNPPTRNMPDQPSSTLRMRVRRWFS